MLFVSSTTPALDSIHKLESRHKFQVSFNIESEVLTKLNIWTLLLNDLKEGNYNNALF